MKIKGLSKTFSGIFIGTLGFLFVFSIVFIINLHTTGEILKKGIEIWKPEIAKALVDERWLIMDKIGQSISSQGVDSIQIKKGAHLVYSYPPMVAEKGCTLALAYPLEHYGVSLGEVIACRTWSYHLFITIISPLFLCTILLSLFFFFIVKATALTSYRDTLLKTLHSLKQWANGSDFLNDNRLLPKSSDPIEREFLELVSAGTSIRLENEKIKTKLLMSETSSKIAAQVAHDIRSPLAALEMVMGGISKLPEKERIIVRSAVSRIRDIANDLLSRGKGTNTKTDPLQSKQTLNQEPTQTTILLLSSLVDTMVTEKRMQFRSKLGIEIDANLTTSSYGLFSNIDPVEFKRILSNLINNSVEALGDRGRVEVIIESSNSEATLRISDNGKGIPPEILVRLGERGETHGKQGGSGLGLYHAKTCLNNWGGSLTLSSESGKGTTATLRLPRAEAPDWFVPKLMIAEKSFIVILDDDTSIHQLWQGRLDALRAVEKEIQILHFSTESEIKFWHENFFKEHSNSHTPTALFLVDYELLGQNVNGLSIIESLGIQKQSILVTSRFEEPNIREKCREQKVRLIPKGMAGFVPIEFQLALEYPDAVLIDDDSLVRLTWESIAQSKNKTLKAFTSPHDFFSASDRLDSNVEIYIDSNLSNGVKGEKIAQEIFSKGFHNLYLATGYDASSFPKMPWLKGIIGKEPPWLGTIQG